MTVKSIAPFRVDPIPFIDGDGFKRIIVEDAQANIVAEILPMADQVANAAMFAAGPVMLAALAEISAIRTNCPAGAEMDGYTARQMADIADKAIKATKPVSYLRSLEREAGQ